MDSYIGTWLDGIKSSRSITPRGAVFVQVLCGGVGHRWGDGEGADVFGHPCRVGVGCGCEGLVEVALAEGDAREGRVGGEGLLCHGGGGPRVRLFLRLGELAVRAGRDPDGQSCRHYSEHQHDDGGDAKNGDHLMRGSLKHRVFSVVLLRSGSRRDTCLTGSSTYGLRLPFRRVALFRGASSCPFSKLQISLRFHVTLGCCGRKQDPALERVALVKKGMKISSL